mmetsp:Transcript_75402/g.166829  ORF Transcript_75402/g.166829 Transcript_75402/m.166829 type:complete len:899 (+) Transcript_75402:59-2755(+)
MPTIAGTGAREPRYAAFSSSEEGAADTEAATTSIGASKAHLPQRWRIVLAACVTLALALALVAAGGHRPGPKTSILEATASLDATAAAAPAAAPAAAAPAAPAAAAEKTESPCAASGQSCLTSKCCRGEGMQCFAKNDYWATCRSTCVAGIDPNDKDKTPWTCKPLGIPEMWTYNEGRARKILSKLTLEEKINLLRGKNADWPNDRHGYAGYVAAGSSYGDAWKTKGIMPLSMNDGPQGFNSYGTSPGTSTQFPALLTVAASFDPEAARRYAAAIAEEFIAKGANVLLGPDVEVTRATLTGRSFETISGEDPYLGSKLVQPFIKAIQDRGIIATVKHWLDNNQEIFRLSMNAEVADRAQHEIYMPVFKAAFDAGAAGLMCSYNKVYGVHACENSKLLKQLLRTDAGFRGYVISDWGATHDALRSALAGLDIDMQGADPVKRLPDEFHKLPALLKAGAITQALIDEKVLHVLAAMYVTGQFDGRFPIPETYVDASIGKQRAAVHAVVRSDATSAAHLEVAKQTIIDGAVLLKNEGSTLPLVTSGKKIALVGKYCDQKTESAYGQGDVYSGGGSGYVKTGKQVTPVQGLQARIKDATVTWTATAAGAADADVAVVCAAGHSEEGWDRKSLELPEANQLVTELRSQPGLKKIVVLAIAPGAITTEWMAHVDAALLLFMPGEQVGPAVAALITGDAGPGGRLPISLPKVGEARFTAEQYPGVCPPPKTWCPHMTANFSEGVLVGYRWNDAKGVPSAYPFGFGLAYTDFVYRGFKATCTAGKATVSLTVANVGARQGSAVPQLYVGFPSLKPVLRNLRGFQKVIVPRNGAVDVAFALGDEDFSFWDMQTQAWASALQRGEAITVSVGTSSANLLWNTTLVCGDKAEDIIASGLTSEAHGWSSA